MEKHKNITLAQAAKILGYTPEHVNHLARSGRLAATKEGRNWVTTKEAIKDYKKTYKVGTKAVGIKKRARKKLSEEAVSFLSQNPSVEENFGGKNRNTMSEDNQSAVLPVSITTGPVEGRQVHRNILHTVAQEQEKKRTRMVQDGRFFVMSKNTAQMADYFLIVSFAIMAAGIIFYQTQVFYAGL